MAGLPTASVDVNATAMKHTVTKIGVHRLMFRRADPTVVLQRLLSDTGGRPAPYPGPPESRRQ
ncbi:hypothetical protein ACIRU3_01875 [Streptomyces sp. NPDC101151]|uniref:hypothetical protein n=1 Tax=Streptomyces sp. NPDC101151 TaxID=3366115 RepID=UPI003823B758